MVKSIGVEVFMQQKLLNRKKKVIYNIIFRLVTLVSIAIMLLLCIYLRKLGTIPKLYLVLIYCGIGIIYMILTFLIVPRKFKLNIKIIVATIFIIIDFISVFSIRKIDKKISVIKNVEITNKDSN
jgi:hypothetical protein